jgi:hypothetical protein
MSSLIRASLRRVHTRIGDAARHGTAAEQRSAEAVVDAAAADLQRQRAAAEEAAAELERQRRVSSDAAKELLRLRMEAERAAAQELLKEREDERDMHKMLSALRRANGAGGGKLSDDDNNAEVQRLIVEASDRATPRAVQYAVSVAVGYVAVSAIGFCAAAAYFAAGGSVEPILQALPDGALAARDHSDHPAGLAASAIKDARHIRLLGGALVAPLILRAARGRGFFLGRGRSGD